MLASTTGVTCVCFTTVSWTVGRGSKRTWNCWEQSFLTKVVRSCLDKCGCLIDSGFSSCPAMMILMQAGYPTTPFCYSRLPVKKKILSNQTSWFPFSPFQPSFYFQDDTRGPHEMEEAGPDKFHHISASPWRQNFNTSTILTWKQENFADAFPDSFLM